jgi:hypothetical protein
MSYLADLFVTLKLTVSLGTLSGAGHMVVVAAPMLDSSYAYFNAA